MEALNLFQTLLILSVAGLTVAIVVNTLFDVLVKKQEWHRWGPFD